MILNSLQEELQHRPGLKQNRKFTILSLGKRVGCLRGGQGSGPLASISEYKRRVFGKREISVS